MERLVDGTLRFRRPDGKRLPDVSPSPVVGWAIDVLHPRALRPLAMGE